MGLSSSIDSIRCLRCLSASKTAFSLCARPGATCVIANASTSAMSLSRTEVLSLGMVPFHPCSRQVSRHSSNSAATPKSSLARLGVKESLLGVEFEKTVTARTMCSEVTAGIPVQAGFP